ncbi:LacI family DNA-binding transcriptional regulator [Xylocopilactobacillus apis]|uniref:Catabolite control protein A n=1 Tax=Xylocopilactobacillus apis TaxID=2932183 RepID=A0AAU9DEZ7_9LACO|nr:LacI family DNA-binding transcriptional regulator [Xylocopilactobacillus apis]BDR56791.1 catabolite control protein A [Xylocopilactobacillus apis]
MQPKVTIYDVANAANVSMATVSRVMNRNPKVKQETKERVLKVIHDLNYHPNAVAQGLASKKTTTIGVILPDLANDYFANLAVGIDDIALMYNYNIIIANSSEDTEKENKIVDNLLAKQVDGIIYMGRDQTEHFQKSTKDNGTAVVLAGSVDQEGTPSVNINYRKAICDATSFFLKQKQKVALVINDKNYSINSDYRIPGYQDALKKYGVSFDPNLIFEYRDNNSISNPMLQDIYDSDATAAVVYSDDVAIMLLNKGFQLGKSIPDDFQIITSNNTVVTKYARPMISSISQPLYDIGAVAMRILTKIMNNEKVQDKQVFLDYDIIHRGSTRI